MTKRRFMSRGKKSGGGSFHFNWMLLLWIVLGFAVVVAVVLGIWSLYLDKVVREKFEGKKWSLPARVYSRPLELYEGLPLTPVLFEKELEALGYRTTPSVTASGQVSRRAASAQEVTYEVLTR